MTGERRKSMRKNRLYLKKFAAAVISLSMIATQVSTAGFWMTAYAAEAEERDLSENLESGNPKEEPKSEAGAENGTETKKEAETEAKDKADTETKDKTEDTTEDKENKEDKAENKAEDKENKEDKEDKAEDTTEDDTTEDNDKTEDKTDDTTIDKTENETDFDSEEKTESGSEKEMDTNSEGKNENGLEKKTDSESKSEITSETKPETKPETTTETTPESDSETKRNPFGLADDDMPLDLSENFQEVSLDTDEIELRSDDALDEEEDDEDEEDTDSDTDTTTETKRKATISNFKAHYSGDSFTFLYTSVAHKQKKFTVTKDYKSIVEVLAESYQCERDGNTYYGAKVLSVLITVIDGEDKLKFYVDGFADDDFYISADLVFGNGDRFTESVYYIEDPEQDGSELVKFADAKLNGGMFKLKIKKTHGAYVALTEAATKTGKKRRH